MFIALNQFSAWHHSLPLTTMLTSPRPYDNLSKDEEGDLFIDNGTPLLSMVFILSILTCICIMAPPHILCSMLTSPRAVTKTSRKMKRGICWSILVCHHFRMYLLSLLTCTSIIALPCALRSTLTSPCPHDNFWKDGEGDQSINNGTPSLSIVFILSLLTCISIMALTTTLISLCPSHNTHYPASLLQPCERRKIWQSITVGHYWLYLFFPYWHVLPSWPYHNVHLPASSSQPCER